MFLSSFDLWFSRIQRLKRRPSKEVVTFCFKELIKTLKLISASKNNVINLDKVLLGYINEDKLLNDIKKRCRNNFYFNSFDTNLAELYKKRFPNSYNNTLKIAKEYVDGHFNFLGKKVQFEDWHSIGDVRWPLKGPSRKINYFGLDRKGDIKYIWELNRMQFLQLLGKSYFLTYNEKYSRSVLDYIDSWIDGNSYPEGVNWMEGIEAAIRMYSWIFAYYLILSSPSLKPALNDKILKSIYQHAKFIRSFNSDKWIINNNHIIAELSGLILIGLSFPQFKESSEWVNFALQKLEKEVDRQIFDDGFLWEHSLGYHKFVTELIALVVILLKKNGYNVPRVVYNKLEKMFVSLNYVSMKNNKITLVGDEDQGYVLKLTNAEYDDISEVMSLGGILFDRDDFFKENYSELVFWLFNGKIIGNENISSQLSSFKFFEDSGYGVFRDNDDYLLFVTSAQDKRYLHAGHRHLDMLSFIYEKNGEYFIVDPGSYTYFADDELRNRFRGISMHNTVTIDGKEPCDLSGLFELYPRPYAKVVSFRTMKEGICYIHAKHNGYKPLIHDRILFSTEDAFIVYDKIDGKSKIHGFEGHLHLHPKVEVNRLSDKKIVLKKGNEQLFVISDKKMNVVDSLYSPQYGVKLNSKSISIKYNGSRYENYIYLLKNSTSDSDEVVRNSKEVVNKTMENIY